MQLIAYRLDIITWPFTNADTLQILTRTSKGEEPWEIKSTRQLGFAFIWLFLAEGVPSLEVAPCFTDVQRPDSTFGTSFVFLLVLQQCQTYTFNAEGIRKILREVKTLVKTVVGSTNTSSTHQFVQPIMKQIQLLQVTQKAKQDQSGLWSEKPKQLFRYKHDISCNMKIQRQMGGLDEYLFGN